MFSNKYIFIYATILVIAIAALLSTTAKFLQPFQERNARIEKIQDILTSAGIESTKENAEHLFDKHIIAELLIDRHGKVINDGRDPFDMDLKIELRKLQDLETEKSNVEPVFPLFVCEYNGKKTYIVPMLGKGLYGPLWGYMALKDDYSTILGVVFDHKGETAGLGAEISNSSFHDLFAGKKIFDKDDKFVSVELVKGGVANSRIKPEHGVDALSGATVTSTGLSAMIKQNLANYVNYFKNQRIEIILEQEREKFVQDSIALDMELQAQAQAEAEAARLRQRAIWLEKQRAAEREAANQETSTDR
ncbi:MAG: NADH:ubiquinone reductase (Na(+)-transporting) subunit C [Bacteroidales bacterium]|jgi:Na+-transporting NADH:ubiquinone oxidoreductase subunit C|nr:NADH:ubiquinone reductase (Na(+)-transporting) subunit C [Bacteroidales bacterium]